MDREVRLQQARNLDNISTALVNAGINVVKRNPIPSAAYVFGVLICLFFSGFNVSPEMENQFHSDLRSIDYESYEKAELNFANAEDDYRRSKGWFTCDKHCQVYKMELDKRRDEYNRVKMMVQKTHSDAKAKLGIFSNFGISETRDLFWRRFSQGKGFARRQSQWDALFMGIQAMGRDESLISYGIRLLMTILFNFTIGMIGAVIAFIFGLYGLIQTYQVPLTYAIIFFLMASLAALSFAATWLLGIYAAAAGTVYVGAKMIASNLRLEGTGNYGGRVQGDAYSHAGRRQYRD